MALGRIAAHPLVIAAGFVLAHLWLGYLGLYAPGLPLGDVSLVYKYWVEYGVDTGVWVGLDTVWVYPILALVPMLAAWALGPDSYVNLWLVLVMLLDAAAFAVLVFGRADSEEQRERVRRSAWWWIAFLVALGPVALGRIDAITVAVAVAGMLVLARHPRVAGALLAVATWIKVWPAALVAAVIVAVRRRLSVLAGAAATTLVVLVAVIALGGAASVFSFVTEQTGRGLQVEAVIATPWMWDAFAGGGTVVYYDRSILTFQLAGPGVAGAAAIATRLLVLVVGALLVVALVGVRRRVPTGALLPPLVLAITVGLIVANKVGSPQFVTWLAVPILYGLVTAARGEGRSFRVPALMGLAIAGLTQGFYPYAYSDLLGLGAVTLILLTARNVLYVALLVWAVATLVHAVVVERHGEPEPLRVPDVEGLLAPQRAREPGA